MQEFPKGSKRGGPGDNEVPQCHPGTKPREGAETKCEITVQFLTFYCKKNQDLMSRSRARTALLCANNKKIQRFNGEGFEASSPSITPVRVRQCRHRL